MRWALEGSARAYAQWRKRIWMKRSVLPPVGGLSGRVRSGRKPAKMEGSETQERPHV